MEPVLVHATVPASNCQWFHPFSRPYNVPIPPFPRKQHKLHNPREEDEAEEKEVEEVEETRGRPKSFMAAEATCGKVFTYDDVGWRRPTKTPLSTGEKAEAPHFLHACALCKKTLGTNDIFMYRGDTPFCSEECRQEQMDRDEMKERKWSNLAAKALARKDKNKDSIQLTATETLVPG